MQEGTKLCPKCYKVVPKDAVLCPYCGYRFPQKVEESPSLKCPNCGREVPSDAVLCPYCGYRLQSPQQVYLAPSPPSHKKHKLSSTKLIAIIVISFLIGIAIAGAIAYYYSHTYPRLESYEAKLIDRYGLKEVVVDAKFKDILPPKDAVPKNEAYALIMTVNNKQVGIGERINDYTVRIYCIGYNFKGGDYYLILMAYSEHKYRIHFNGVKISVGQVQAITFPSSNGEVLTDLVVTISNTGDAPLYVSEVEVTITGIDVSVSQTVSVSFSLDKDNTDQMLISLVNQPVVHSGYNYLLDLTIYSSSNTNVKFSISTSFTVD